MSEVSAEKVRELREKSGAGIMDCKRALAAASGDLTQAIDLLRKEGVVKAAKKSGRVTLEGLVAVGVSPDRARASLVEVNCETDFVARTDPFQEFVSSVAELVIRHQPGNPAALLKLETGKTRLEEALAQLIARVGENISIRRFRLVQADLNMGEALGHYLHAGSKIGVLIKIKKGSEELARDVSMHVAAMSPHYLDRARIPEAVLEREREIAKASPELADKPAPILGKIIEGKLNRYFSEVCLLEQPFVKDPTGKKSVSGYLKERAPGAEIVEMVRFQVGEEVS